MAKTLQIFEAGTHTSSSGDRRTWTKSDLHEIASSYNADRFKAPLIVSHNTEGVEDHRLPDSELAYGYPDSLRVEGNKLFGIFSRVAPQVSNWIKDGRILAVSPSIYLPNSPGNPAPGKFSLRHIALLGKSPPAVKGMEAPAFSMPFSDFDPSATDPKAIAFDCSISVSLSEETMTRNTVQGEKKSPDFMDSPKDKSKNPLDSSKASDSSDEDEGMDDEDQESMMPATTKKKGLVAAASMSESSQGTVSIEEFRELQANFNALKSQSERERQAFALRQAEQERKEVSSFVAQQVEDGRLLAAHREAWTSSLLAIPTSTEISYSEGEKATPVRDRIMQMISEMPSVIELREMAGVDSAPSSSSQVQGFNAADGYVLDPNSSKTMQQALAYCEKHNLNPSDSEQLITAIHAVSK